MSLGSLTPIANHLWQSTLFAGMVLLLTLVMRKNGAQARYLLWLAASLKFLVPFALLVAAGGQLETRTLPAIAPAISVAAEQVSQAFEPIAIPSQPADAAWGYRALPAVWFTGFAAVVCVWWVRWRRIHAALRQATPLHIEAPIPVMSAPTLLEPGVFGLSRPVLLLPQGIAERLAPAQLRAILAHELCHVRRRDNLAAAVHMFVEAVFWFHPLVWWIGGRLVDERERACDEEVLRMGSEREVYAEGILNVCKFYVASPMACASGVTGSDLKKRIEAIMTNPVLAKMSFARKLVLVTAGLAAVASPILIGLVTAPLSRAQTKPDTLTFEVASIKPSEPDSRNRRIQFTPGGGLNIDNIPLKELVEFAYGVLPQQVSGGPDWVSSDGFNIIAKAPESGNATPIGQMTETQRTEIREQMRERLRMLLAERFQLRVRRDSKEMPVYALVVAKNGPRIKQSTGAGASQQRIMMGRGELNGDGMTMQMLATSLSRQVGRVVLDKTGLTGGYEVKLQWTPEFGGPGGPRGPGGPGGPGGAGAPGAGAPTTDLSGPSIFTALQEQLGLRLESTKGPVETIVIERAEKPSAN